MISEGPCDNEDPSNAKCCCELLCHHRDK